MYDYCIVGGGIAGLYFAWSLKKSNSQTKIVILEKHSQLGGRYFTGELTDFRGNKARFSLGPGVIREKDVLLKRLLTELGIRYDRIEDNVVKYINHPKPNKSELERLLRDMRKKYIDNRLEILQKRLNFKEFVRIYFDSKDSNMILNCMMHKDMFRADVEDTLNFYPDHEIFVETATDPLYVPIPGWYVIIEKLSKFLFKYVSLDSTVTSVTQLDNECRITYTKNGNTKRLECRNVVFACTVSTLHEIKIVPEMNLSDIVGSVPFVRTYSTHEGPLPDQNVLPENVILNPHGESRIMFVVNREIGLLQSIYSSGEECEYWETVAKDFELENTFYNTKDRSTHSIQRPVPTITQQKLNLMVQSHINQTLGPGYLPKVKESCIHYHKDGVHYFKPKSLIDASKDREQHLKDMIHPEKRFWIIGEMVSLHQGWTEGALESVERILSLMKEVDPNK